MRLLHVVILLAFAGGVLGGKGRGGGGRGRSKGGGSGGWFFGGKNKKPTGEANYPRQPSPAAPPEARPPAYNPGYPGPPPVYSKNAPPYPQSGGHAPPPPYSQYPQQGHYPHYPQQGHFPQQGHYPQYGGYGQGNSNPQGHFSGFPQYPQHYSGGFGTGGFGHGNGYFGGYPKRKGLGFPGIIPIPIPIPFGGGGFGYGSYGGGYYRNRGSSEVVRDRESRGQNNQDDSKERPRIMAPPDFELEGVTELPGDVPIAQWDIVGKETAAEKLKKSDDYSGEFRDDN